LGSFGTIEIILILIAGFIILDPKGLSKLVKTVVKILGELPGIKEEVKKSMTEINDSIDDAVLPLEENDYQYDHKEQKNHKKINKENT
jgi:Sec-independent protein translocase protein TatA